MLLAQRRAYHGYSANSRALSANRRTPFAGRIRRSPRTGGAQWRHE
jgi:hypothetical protein